MGKHNNYTSHSLVIVGVLSLGFSYSYPEYLGFLSFFFLFFILEGFRMDKKSVSRPFLFFGLLAAFLYATSWILDAYPLDWLHIYSKVVGITTVGAIWFLFSSVLAFFFCYLIILSRNILLDFTPISSLVIIPAVWVVVEWIKSFVIIFGLWGSEAIVGPHHTYFSLGYLITNIPILKDLISLGGLYLAVFFIVFVNMAVLLWKRFREKQKFLIIFFGFLVIVMLFGYRQYLQIEIAKSQGVLLLQTNYGVITNDQQEQKKISTTIDYIEQKKADKIIVVAPENINFSSHVFAEVGNLYVSSYRGERYYNMFGVSGFGIQTIQKRLLMPLGEYDVYLVSKLFRILGLSNKYITDLDKTYSQHGYLYNPMVWNGFKLGGVLCSENISPIIFQNQIRNGADFFVSVSSLAPFHNSEKLARQTVALFRARALETNRDIVVSANNAPSYIIRANGKLDGYIHNKNVLIQSIQDEVGVRTRITVYSLFGDFVVLLSSMILFIFFILKTNQK